MSAEHRVIASKRFRENLVKSLEEAVEDIVKGRVKPLEEVRKVKKPH